MTDELVGVCGDSVLVTSIFSVKSAPRSSAESRKRVWIFKETM